MGLRRLTAREDLPERDLKFSLPGWASFWLAGLRIVAVALVVAYVGSLWFVTRPPNGYVTLWDGWVFTVASLLPMGLLLLRAYFGQERRQVWVLFAVGIALNAVGNLVYSYHDQNLTPVPNPAISDIPRLLSYLAFALAVLQLTRISVGSEHRNFWLDGAIAGLSAGAITDALFFGVIPRGGGSVGQSIIALAYPGCDLLLIILLIASLAPRRQRPSWPALGVTLALACMAVGDVVYIKQIAAGTYVSGTPLETTWIIGVLLIGLAAWFPENPGSSPNRVGSRSPTTIPSILALTALALLFVATFRSVPPSASLLAIAAVALVVLRMLLTVKEVRRAAESHRQARTDELTGLANRRAFIEELDAQLAREEPVAVLVIDLNGFKDVNDTVGHDVGDALLQAVAGRLVVALGSSGGLLARLGGDEFGAFAANQDGANTEGLARAVQNALRAPFPLPGLTLNVSASVGVALAPLHSRSRVELLRCADVAMYQAKRQHLPSLVYELVYDHQNRDRLAVVNDLKIGIDRSAFVLDFQPLLNLSTGRVSGVEALVRWKHPTLGRLTPDDFVPLAERVGLISNITRVVLALGMTNISRLRRNDPELGISINLSGHDLADESLVALVQRLLSEHHVSGTKLTLEITESALVLDPPQAQRTIRALRALGIRIAVDDFGTGYSSMGRLARMSVDELKIDKSLVQGIAGDPRLSAVVGATVQLARALRLDVVAEGVEDLAALDAVRSLGCTTAQGYHIARPMPVSDLELFLAKQPSVGCTNQLPAVVGANQ